MDQGIELIQSALRDILFGTASPESAARITTALVALAVVTQLLKKTVESMAAARWTGDGAGPIRRALLWLAHGDGPIVLNMLSTLSIVLIAGATDQSLAAVPAWQMTAAAAGIMAGTDGTYRAIRSFVFPNRTVEPARQARTPAIAQDPAPGSTAPIAQPAATVPAPSTADRIFYDQFVAPVVADPVVQANEPAPAGVEFQPADAGPAPVPIGAKYYRPGIDPSESTSAPVLWYTSGNWGSSVGWDIVRDRWGQVRGVQADADVPDVAGTIYAIADLVRTEVFPDPKRRQL